MWKILLHKAIAIALLFILSTNSSYGQQVALRNNLLYDATLTPNLSIDYQVAPKWSVGMNAGFRHWPIGNLTKHKWRHLLLSPEVRHWKDSLQVGQFWGVNAIYSHFNAGYTDMIIYKGVKDERRQGDLVALGAFYGHSWRLGRHWTMEAVGGIAVGYAWYDRFVMSDNCDCWKAIGDGNSLFLLPQLGLNIVYHFQQKSKERRNEKTERSKNEIIITQ